MCQISWANTKRMRNSGQFEQSEWIPQRKVSLRMINIFSAESDAICGVCDRVSKWIHDDIYMRAHNLYKHVLLKYTLIFSTQKNRAPKIAWTVIGSESSSTSAEKKLKGKKKRNIEECTMYNNASYKTMRRKHPTKWPNMSKNKEQQPTRKAAMLARPPDTPNSTQTKI